MKELKESLQEAHGIASQMRDNPRNNGLERLHLRYQTWTLAQMIRLVDLMLKIKNERQR